MSRAQEKTPLHSKIKPGGFEWIGVSSGMRGLSFNYVIGEHKGRAELYIDRGAGQTDTNKKLFDALLANKEGIEKAFEEPLLWDRLDGKRACRISHTVDLGGYRDDEGNWPAIQDSMISAMIRLEGAVGPHIAELRRTA